MPCYHALMDIWVTLEGLEGASFQTLSWGHPFTVDRVTAEALVVRTARGVPIAISRRNVEAAWERYTERTADFAARARTELGINSAVPYLEAVFEALQGEAAHG